MIVFDFIEQMKPFGIFSVSYIENMYSGLDKWRLFEFQFKAKNHEKPDQQIQ